MDFKNIRHILLIGFIAFAGIAASCVRETLTDFNVPGDPAVIELAASGSTRGTIATEDNLGADDFISSLRIMLFNSGSGAMAYNFVLTATELAAMNNSSNPVPYKMTITTGTFDFVFIANEDSDTELRGGSTLTDILDAYTTSNTLSEVMNLHFLSSAFQNNLTIPMTALFRNAKVSISNTITLEGNSMPEVAPWRVGVERAAVRVDLIMKTTSPYGAANFTDFLISNVPNKVYLFPVNASNTPLYNITGSGAGPFETTIRTIAGDDGDKYSIVSGVEYFEEVDEFIPFVEDPTTPGDYYWYKRIILPSSMFTPANDELNAIVLSAVVGGNTLSTTLGTSILGYTAGRNNRYRLVANLKADVEMTLNTTIVAWNTTNININELERPIVPEDPIPDGVIQPEANSYIIPKGWDTPILIPISQAAKGYAVAGLNTSMPSTVGFKAKFLWGEMGTAGATTATSSASDVGTIRVAGDYILVQAGNKEGNFVIEMTSANDVHIWSWHIWVTDGYYPYVTANNKPNSETPDATVWMPYNLGAFYANAAGTSSSIAPTNVQQRLDARGLYYQWGRKDPTPMIAGGVYAAANLLSAADVIAHPRTFATNTFYGTLQGNTAANDSWGNNGAKSFFDPCPPGYRVPGATIWKVASGWTLTPSSGGTHATQGDYYPYAGFRTADTGTLVNIWFTGNVWSATAHSASSGYWLNLPNSGSVSMSVGDRSSGGSVRCVSNALYEGTM